jgi:DNA end-binding protein Ku
MARGLWKGAISFGLVHVPVELHPALKRSSELDVTMLDRRDLAPVGYKRYNKSTGEDVPWGDIVKGYQYEDGRYVVLSEEDFRRANAQAARTVEILAFVDLAEIAPMHFDTPYYLAPGRRGEKAYALLREAIKRTGEAGIATVVIRPPVSCGADCPGRCAGPGDAALRV